MRRVIGFIAVAAVMLTASTALGQDNTKTKFYNFDDMLIDGEIKVPDAMKNEAREKAKFKRLLSLKKSFLPKVRETAEESALQ